MFEDNDYAILSEFLARNRKWKILWDNQNVLRGWNATAFQAQLLMLFL